MAFGFTSGGLAGAFGHPEVSQYIDPRRNMLLGLAAGLVGGPNWSQGLSSGFQMAAQGGAVDRAAAEKAKADELAAKQTAAARTWFEKNAPQYVPMLDAGMSTGEAWNNYFRGQNKDATNPYMSAGDGKFFNWQTGQYVTDPNAQPDMPNAPAGYRWTQDGGALERIPGGPEDPSINADLAKVNLQRVNSQTDNVISAIDKATNQTAWDSTGALGQMLGVVGGTKAFDLRETAKTIKANLGFAELQAMREASPTGGALGQVAVQELEALQATLASLNPDQSEGQLRQNLARVKELLERQKMFREQSNQVKYAEPGVSGDGGVEDLVTKYLQRQ